MPIEVMAARGVDTLRFGPMKPVGLDDPKTGRWPYAVVQLRQDNALGTLWNMVGFQTKLKYAEQVRLFRTIPGIENRSEEHTTELQSRMRISYAVFCLKKKKSHTRER